MGNRVTTRNTFFGENIEYFNGYIWKPIKDYTKGEKVLTFFPKDKHVELLTPICYTKRKSEGLNRVTAKGDRMDILLSDDAEFIGLYRDSNKDRNYVNDGKFTDRISNFTLDEALHSGKNFSIFSHCLIFSTFNYNSNTNSQLTENKIILMLKSIMYGRIENNNTCYIEWEDDEKDKRYIKQWEVLLNKCKIRFNRNNRKKILSFRLPRSKDIFIKNILTYSNEEIRFMVDEIDRMNNMSNIIKLKDIESLDFIQMVYALYGKILLKRDDHLIKIKTLGTRISIKEIKYFKCKYEYSFTTRSGYIVIRNNGNIYTFGDYKK